MSVWPCKRDNCDNDHTALINNTFMEMCALFAYRLIGWGQAHTPTLLSPLQFNSHPCNLIGINKRSEPEFERQQKPQFAAVSGVNKVFSAHPRFDSFELKQASIARSFAEQ